MHIAFVGGTVQLEYATCCLRRIRGGQGASAEAGSSGPESQPSKSLVSNSTESRFREVGARGWSLLQVNRLYQQAEALFEKPASLSAC